MKKLALSLLLLLVSCLSEIDSSNPELVKFIKSFLEKKDSSLSVIIKRGQDRKEIFVEGFYLKFNDKEELIACKSHDDCKTILETKGVEDLIKEVNDDSVDPYAYRRNRVERVSDKITKAIFKEFDLISNAVKTERIVCSVVVERWMDFENNALRIPVVCSYTDYYIPDDKYNFAYFYFYILF
jgi:hypothetical protein